MKMSQLLGTLACVACLVGFSSPADALGLLHKDACAPACCPPPPPIKLVLQVCHPCTGCKYEVPVCLPACCLGEPCVHFEKTLIGNGKTVYQWQCGHKVVIRYPHAGGYTVHERG